MKNKILLFCLGFALIITGCSKKEPAIKPTPAPVVTTPTGYTITENFENGTKSGYAIADVVLSTGSWSFNDALVGNTSADLKDGSQAVRLRTGDIAMNFDISGVSTLYIKHGKYGTDAASAWQLEM